jgi:hypothetical protein
MIGLTATNHGANSSTMKKRLQYYHFQQDFDYIDKDRPVAENIGYER